MATADPVDLVTGLMALSPRDVEAQTLAEAEATVIACERALAALQGRQALAMDVLASRFEEDLDQQRAERPDDPSLRHVDVHGMTASMLAPALHSATRTVRARIERSRWTCMALASTSVLLWAGDLDRARADVVLQAAETIDLDLWDEFEGRVYDTALDETSGEVVLASGEVLGLSRSELARRAQRIARSLDPEADRAALARAREACDLTVRPDRHHPGLAHWRALIPSETSQQMSAAVETLAGQYARANPGTPISNHRADALADLVLGNATITTTVEVLVPVQPLSDEAATVSAGRAPEQEVPAWLVRPVEDPRHGCLAPEVLAKFLAHPDTLIRLARLDADGSIVQDPEVYRPNRAMRRRVKSRDGGCRFPGCRVPAKSTDLDHVVPFPVGPTTYGNLICLCRTHHLFKHHGGWTCVLHPDGTTVWTTPDGRTFTTHPQSAEAARTLLDAEAADTETAHQLTRGWIPGLPAGMTMTQLAAEERTTPDDPPESDRIPPAPADWAALPDPVDLGPPKGLTPPAVSPLERSLARLLALAA